MRHNLSKHTGIANYRKLKERNQITDQYCCKTLFPVEEVIQYSGKNN